MITVPGGIGCQDLNTPSVTPRVDVHDLHPHSQDSVLVLFHAPELCWPTEGSASFS